MRPAAVKPPSPGPASPAKSTSRASRVVFDLALRRLRPASASPGLISLTVRRPTILGTLTDAALRARLAHFDAHSANEIAALRRALDREGGEYAFTEEWRDREEFLKHWCGFLGSPVQPMDWTCEECGDTGAVRLGRAAGEAVQLRCARGHAVAIAAWK